MDRSSYSALMQQESFTSEEGKTWIQKLIYPKQKFEYDTRIDEYNWYMIFFTQFAFYFILQILVRRYAPEPGDIKVFREKKKMNEYHFYYFQYTSLVHALVGCIAGKMADCVTELYRSSDNVLRRLQI